MTEPNYTYHAKVIRWIDGDTVDLMVDLGFSTWVKERFRLVFMDGSGFNAPEVRGEERERGLEALDRVNEMLPYNSSCIVKTFKVDEEKRQETGSWGRWLAGITLRDSVADVRPNSPQSRIQFFQDVAEKLVLEGLGERKEY